MDAKQFTNLVKEIKQINQTPDKKISRMVDTQPVTQKKKKALFAGIGDLVKKAAPVAANFIPGVGPLASQLLSTLNDDEWFDKYNSAGASFNEMLTTKVIIAPDSTRKKPKISVQPRAAFMRFATDVALGNKSLKDIYGSSLLATIRDKTNNVLVSNVEDYYTAFASSARLLAIYYTLEKYTMFAKTQPINIPVIDQLIEGISPTNINKLNGMKESLKNFISSTIRLPYALTEAIRWRFGTMFHTFNTGQPGFVTYDIINIIEFHADSLQIDIQQLQAEIMNAGRASADIYTTFKNHIQRLDVEKAHYDEKEFNLRHNLTLGEFENLKGEFLFDLIKDSRLANSPAVQASTLSTNIWTPSSNVHTNLALFPVEVELDINGPLTISRIYHYITHDLDSYKLTDPQLTFLKSVSKSGWNAIDMGNFYNDLHYVEDSSSTGKIQLASNTTRNTIADLVSNNLVTSLAASMGIYRKALRTGFRYDPLSASYVELDFKMDSDLISYDLAKIAGETLLSIQTAAIRNLLRGDYAGPKPELVNKDIKPLLSEVVTEIIE